MPILRNFRRVTRCATWTLATFLSFGAPAPLAAPATKPNVVLPRHATSLRVCSHALPLCLMAPSTDQWFLSELEQAWMHARVYGFSAPDVALRTGTFDVELHTLSGDPTSRDQEHLALSAIDRSVVKVQALPPHATGCEAATLAHQLILTGSMARTNPSMLGVIGQGLTRAIAATLSGCTLAQDHDGERPWAHPESSIFRNASNAAYFFQWLDTYYSKEPLAVLHDILALSPTQSPPYASTFTHEPDVFDVMKESFGNLKFKGSKFEDILIDFAVERALDPEAQGKGTEGHWVDWEVAWPSTPRRLLATRAVDPLGASLVKIRTAGRRPQAALRVEATWEFEAHFRWCAVMLDAQGKHLRRIVLTAPERAVDVQMSLRTLEDVAEVWLVAINLGDPKRPLDPDELATEPHKWTLTVGEE